MRLYDTVYAELDCPFCGKQYRHTPMTREKAEKLVKQNKQNHLDLLHDHKKYSTNYPCVQKYLAEKDGFLDVELWISQLDSAKNIQKCRTLPILGLVEIPTRELCGEMKVYLVGDKINQYWGHYFIQERFNCEGCRSANQPENINVWLEIEDRTLKAVLVRNPETGLPENKISHL